MIEILIAGTFFVYDVCFKPNVYYYENIQRMVTVISVIFA